MQITRVHRLQFKRVFTHEASSHMLHRMLAFIKKLWPSGSPPEKDAGDGSKVYL